MALPKRQHSKTRGRKRRTHWGVKAAQMTPCPSCQKPIIPHRVCPFCGHYKGQQYVEIKVKKEKNKE